MPLAGVGGGGYWDWPKWTADRSGFQQLDKHHAVYATEDTPLGTAGSVRNAMDELDDSFLVMFNGSDEDIKWTVPEPVHGPWQIVFDTARPSGGVALKPKTKLSVRARSVVVYLSENDTAG